MSSSFVADVFWPFFLCGLVSMLVMGPDAMEAVTRIMGFLLVCIGVQFVGSGVRTFMSGS